MALVTRNEGSKVNSNIMVITPMVQNKVNVNLAVAPDATPMPDADHEDQALVAITRDGRVYLGANQVSIDDLGAKVNDILNNKPSKIVYLRADQRANYGTVMSAVDAVRTAGVDQLGILTEPAPSGLASAPPPKGE